MLGHRRENVYGELRGVRVIDGHEFDARIHQRGDEGDIAGETVQLCYHKARLAPTTKRKRLDEFRTVVALARLDFGELI